MSAEPTNGWQSANWQPTPEEPYQPRGESVPLLGGPLDGRTAHVQHAEDALWVAWTREGGFEVQSAPTQLPTATGARLLGR